MSREYINNKALEEAIANFRESKRERVRYGYLMGDMRQAIAVKTKRRKGTEQESETLAKIAAMHSEALGAFESWQSYLTTEFYRLSENIVRFAKFRIDSDDATQEGVLICFEKADRFDPQKGRAFNYFTTCTLNHFRQIFRTNKNYNELKKKYFAFMQSQTCKQIIKNGKDISTYEEKNASR